VEFKFIVPSQVIFGLGCIPCLPAKVKELKAKRPLVATSSGMLQRYFAVTILSYLESSNIGYETYNRISPEPSTADVENCYQFAAGANCDIIIGLGGGSVMDVAKKVAMDLGIPKIMVPTTAGTGSEVTHESVLKVGGTKKALVDIRLTPDIAIIDPWLVMSLPQRLAASSGIDALAHAAESLESKKSNPLVKALAEKAYTLIVDNLTGSVFGDSNARCNMSLGALMAGMAFGNSGTTLAHALSYPLSNRGIPHGEAVAVVLPYALEFNGYSSSITNEIKRIIKKVNLDLKVEGDIYEMAKMVMQDKRHLSCNPREVAFGDVVDIYKRVLGQN